MERTSAELEGYSLSRNSSRFKFFKPSSSTGRGNAEVGKEIEPRNMEGPSNEAPTSGLGALVIKEAGRSSLTPQRRDTSTELQLKMLAIRLADIKVIDKRLKILEEENDALKRTFYEAVEDRKRLADEIYEQFWIIDRSLRARDQFQGTHASSLVSNSKIDYLLGLGDQKNWDWPLTSSLSVFKSACVEQRMQNYHTNLPKQPKSY